MRVTPRDREILGRVHVARACDSAALAELFPSAAALRQRLWRLTRAHFLKVHRVGNQRVYSLDRRGVQTLGLSTKEIRVSRAAAARHLLDARIRRELQSEGYLLNGQERVGRMTVLRAWRDGRRIAAVVCDPGASRRAVQGVVHRLRALVNPFGALIDELVIFASVRALRVTSTLPVIYRGRVTIRPFTSLATASSARLRASV